MNLGKKFTCFKCKTKFYDLGKPEPMCPKCHTDQRLDPNPSGSDIPTAKAKGGSSASAKRPRPIGEEGEEEEFEEEFIDEGDGTFDDEEDDFSRDYDADQEEREEEHDDDYE